MMETSILCLCFCKWLKTITILFEVLSESISGEELDDSKRREAVCATLHLPQAATDLHEESQFKAAGARANSTCTAPAGGAAAPQGEGQALICKAWL